MPVRRAAFERARIDRELEREVGEGLFHSPGQPAPTRDDRSGAGNADAWAFDGPRRARQLDRRGEKPVRRTAASEKGAVGAASEEYRALAARSGLGLGAARIGRGIPAPERRAIREQRARGAIGIAGPADRRADIHQRLGEIARSPAWRKHPRRRRRFRLAPARSAHRARAGARGCVRYCRRPARSGVQRRSPQSPPQYRRRRRGGRVTPLPRSESTRRGERSPGRRRAGFAPANNSRDRRTRRPRLRAGRRPDPRPAAILR